MGLKHNFRYMLKI